MADLKKMRWKQNSSPLSHNNQADQFSSKLLAISSQIQQTTAYLISNVNVFLSFSEAETCLIVIENCFSYEMSEKDKLMEYLLNLVANSYNWATCPMKVLVLIKKGTCIYIILNS